MKLLVTLCVLGFFVGLVLCSHHRESHRVRFGQHKHDTSSNRNKLSGTGFSKQKTKAGDDSNKVPKCGRVPKVKHDYAVKYKPIVPFGQVPWQAGIFYAKDDSFLCSGTLISAQYVVTAAFCLISIEDHSNLVVRVGDWDISKRDSPYEAYEHYTGSVDTVSILPAGPGIDHINDMPSIPTVALLKLKDEIDFQNYPHIAPICLPAPPSSRHHQTNFERSSNSLNPWKSIYKECYVSGWGHQEPEAAEEPESHLSDELSSFLNQSVKHRPTPAPVSDQIDNIEKENSPRVRSLSLAPALKPSEPFSITIPIISDPDQKAIYMAGNPSGDLFNSSEVFGKMDKNEEKGNAEEVTTQPSFDVLHAIDPLNFGDETMPLPSKPKPRPVPTTTSGPVVNVTVLKRSEGTPEAELAEHIKEEQKLEDILEYSYLDPPEPLEDTMFRHKQKYKSAKKGLGSKPATTSSDEDHSSTQFPFGVRSTGHSSELSDFLSSKQSPAQLNFTEFLLPYSNSIYDNPFPKLKASLKWAPVKFQKKCTDFSPVGKSCVIPANAETDPALCMADLGSGITCSQDKNTARSHMTPQPRRRRNKSETGSEGKPGLAESSSSKTRAVLAGIVTWKRPCFENDRDPSANLTMVTDINDVLSALLEIVNSEPED